MPETRSFAKRLVEQSAGKPVEQLLRELYIDQRFDQDDIAKSLGVSRSTIAAWMAEYGISQDDRPTLPKLVGA